MGGQNIDCYSSLPYLAFTLLLPLIHLLHQPTFHYLTYPTHLGIDAPTYCSRRRSLANTMIHPLETTPRNRPTFSFNASTEVMNQLPTSQLFSVITYITTDWKIRLYLQHLIVPDGWLVESSHFPFYLTPYPFLLFSDL